MRKLTEEQVEVHLPCRVVFPSAGAPSLGGVTENLHRTGVLVACEWTPGRALPQIGELASVDIELPPAENFPPKLIRCDTTLVGIEPVDGFRFQFALQIQKVAFDILTPEAEQWNGLNTAAARYIM